MRAAAKFLLVTVTPVTLAACHKNMQPQADQNIAIDSGNIPENADIEALPSDESSGTPSDQLANGNDNPDVNDLNASSNSY